MKNNSLAIIKAAVAALIIYGLLTSCSTAHRGCAGICSNNGKKPMGKYMHVKKNSKPNRIF